MILSSFFFVFGALFGSFANVLIYRLPREIDFVFKPSHCPKCKNRVRWFDNLPLVSYFILLGKCRFCKEKISFRYFFVEFLMGTAALFLAPLSLNMTSGILFLFYFFTLLFFVTHFFIDIEFQILPDGTNLFLFVMFLTYSLYYNDWQFWLLGAGIGIFFPAIVTFLYYKLRGEIGLGGGDIKLFGILGLYLGPKGVIFNIFLSCFLGSIIGLLLIILRKAHGKTALAFGPFILIVAVIQIYFKNLFDQFLQLIF